MTKRERQRRRAENRRKQRDTARPPTAADDPAMTHWLTPGVHNRRCECCGNKGCIAYRHFDQSTLCELCIERLGIVPRESRAWRRFTRPSQQAGNEGRRPEPQTRHSRTDGPGGEVVPISPSTPIRDEREAA